MIEVSELDELYDILGKNDEVVVVFSARDWCVPCKRLHPHVEAAAERLTDVTFVEVDIDKALDIQREFKVMSVPTVLFYADEISGWPIKARTAPALIAEISAL